MSKTSVPPELMKRLVAARDNLSDALQSTLDSHTASPDLPATVFHFTDTGGMIDIVKTRSLRGTLSSALSDLSEGTIGVERAGEIVEERLSQAGYKGPEHAFDVVLQQLLKEGVHDAMGKVDVRPCVVSFCGSADLSLHWSHYGRNGTGWALGFAASKLAVPGLQFVRVHYKRDAQRQIVDALLSTARAVTSRLTKGLPGDHGFRVGVLCAHITVSFLRISSYVFKREAFQYEDEWRLTFQLIVDAPRSRGPRGYSFRGGYRSVNGRICPFADLFYPKKKFPLESVILGNACAASENDDSIRVLLEDSLGKERGKKVAVTRSEVPIRP